MKKKERKKEGGGGEKKVSFPLNLVRRAIINNKSRCFKVRGIFHEGRIKGLRKIAFNIILDDRFSSKPSARQESSRIPGLLPFLLRPVQTIEIIS